MNAGNAGKDKSGTLTLENRRAALKLIQDVVLTDECEALEFLQAQTAANAEAASERRKSQSTVDRAEIHTTAGQLAAKRARAEVAEEEAAAKDNKRKQRQQQAASKEAAQRAEQQRKERLHASFLKVPTAEERQSTQMRMTLRQVEGTIGLMATKDWLSGDENSAAAGNNAKGPRLTPPNILEALEWAEQRQRALAKVRARRQSAGRKGCNLKEAASLTEQERRDALDLLQKTTSDV